MAAFVRVLDIDCVPVKVELNFNLSIIFFRTKKQIRVQLSMKVNNNGDVFIGRLSAYRAKFEFTMVYNSSVLDLREMYICMLCIYIGGSRYY